MIRSPWKRARHLVLAACAALLLAAPAPAAHDEHYDPQQAGHVLRIAAYAAYPVGFALDWLIFRPAYWLGSHQPFRSLFGREQTP